MFSPDKSQVFKEIKLLNNEKLGEKVSFLFCVHQFSWRNLGKRDFNHTNHHLSTFSTQNCHFYLLSHKVLGLKTTQWFWEYSPLGNIRAQKFRMSSRSIREIKINQNINTSV